MSILWKIAKTPFSLCFMIVKLIFIVLICALVVIGGVNIYMCLSTSHLKYSEQQVMQVHAQAIIVPGASVLPDGSPSTILKDRLDCAAGLYQAGVAPCILVSGSTTLDGYCEAGSMANYLIDSGIPEEDIVQDLSGDTSYATMHRAHYVFGFDTVVISTQAYHLPRCIYCAQGIGMSAVGVDAGVGHIYEDQLYYSIREAFSRVKDFYQVLVMAPAEESAGAKMLKAQLEELL